MVNSTSIVKVGCLNVRGIGVENKINRIKNLIFDHKFNVLLLQELKIHHTILMKFKLIGKMNSKIGSIYQITRTKLVY